MMIIDQWWWLVIPGLLIGLYAQIKLSSTYAKYSQVGVESGLTGAQAAREILDHAGLADVPIEEVGGHLTDHYDPLKKALFLSSDNYHGQSVAAVGVAAHETGHALQHKAAYAPLKLRMAIVPATQFANYAYGGIALLGMFLGMQVFLKFIGIIIGTFAIITFFQLVTLPVEIDASRRAKQQLLQLGLISRGEHEGIEKVLSAAALTYVAALVSAIAQLMHFVLLARASDRD